MPRLFVHCATSVAYTAELSAAIPGVAHYAERALLLARPGDLVCVPGAVEPAYVRFLAELGLGPRAEDIIVVPPSATGGPASPLWHRLLDAPATLAAVARRVRWDRVTELHPFIATDGPYELAAALDTLAGAPIRVVGADPRIVAIADRKDRMRAKAIELGIPVAEGEVIELPASACRRQADLAPIRDAIARYLDRTGRVIVRGACGASGSSAFIVGRGALDLDTAARRIAGRTDNRVYLVEVMVDATVSPNVQLHVAPDGTITCPGITDQRWHEPLAHAGNAFPSTAATADEMTAWARALAAWLRDEGYVGPAGFDFVEYLDPRSGRPRAIFAEVNPRVNAATYPLAVLARLAAADTDARADAHVATAMDANARAGANVATAMDVDARTDAGPDSGAFVSGTIETDVRSFAELRILAGHLLYRAETGRGAVPYCPGLLAYGKCAVMVVGASRNEALRAFAELQTRLSARAVPDAARAAVG